jgi:hypothetical protein
MSGKIAAEKLRESTVFKNNGSFASVRSSRSELTWKTSILIKTEDGSTITVMLQ